MNTQETSQAKKKILKAAEYLFSQKGYDATSVDQIAAMARVNKALIYYYYRNKQALLAALFDDLIADIGQSLSPAKDAGARRSQHNDSVIRFVVVQLINYLETKKNIVRIIMMESLKSDDAEAMFFQFIERLMDSIVRKLAEYNVVLDHDYQQTLLEEFFTGTLPLAAFVVYHDQWKKHFKIRESDLKQRFIDMFMDIHVHHSHSRNYRAKGVKR